jgi:hypothetical protein
MTFSPSTLAGTYGSGDSISLTVRATLTAPLSGEVYLAVVDGAGVLERNVYIQSASGESGAYYATASMSSRLPAGRHQGELEVWLCRDKACSAQHPGSPAYLPYDLQVIQGTNLTPLTRWPSIPDWETYQGNAAHTGYVPVTLDPSRFSPRWSWKPPPGNFLSLSPPVIANGLIYVAHSSSWPMDEVPRTLYAVRESDKETEWLFYFGNTLTVNPPAVSGGKVFVATTGDEDAAMWSLDAATGMKLAKTTFGSYQAEYYAPTIEGGVVYSTCGSSGGMCAFNLADGARNWSTPLDYDDDWTPAVDANHAYSFLRGKLSALVKSTGQVAFTITDPRYNGFDTFGTPALGSNGAVIVVSGGNIFEDNRLVSFNTATRGVNWSVTGRFGVAPVLAKGVVYVTTIPTGAYRPRLEARRESTGALLWSWTPPDSNEMPREGSQGGYCDLLVTDNLIFMSTSARVHAIDLTTRRSVWSYWKTGNLALSANGVLYINSGGTLGAVNLK